MKNPVQHVYKLFIWYVFSTFEFNSVQKRQWQVQSCMAFALIEDLGIHWTPPVSLCCEIEWGCLMLV